ncbi:MAG: ribosome-associated translation inhibitor RaiA [Coxiella endosymbiont of Haemaphysalis qinghaiensis]
MQIQMTGHGLDISTALRELAEKKLNRLHPCFDEITNIHITFRVDKIRQIADANLQLPGSRINAQAESEDMYQTIDLLIQKLQTQLTKYKSKKDDHR